MAIVSIPRWTPDPVGSLPIDTTIEFTVIPGVFAQEGIVVEYVLHSDRAQFRNDSQPPQLPDAERTGSAPAPPGLEPRRRGTALVVDRYQDAKPDVPLEIKRVLCLTALPSGSRGISSITVTVSDLKAGGVPTDVAVQSDTIGL